MRTLRRSIALVTLCLLALAACSYSPDWARPGASGQSGETTRRLADRITRTRQHDRAASRGVLGVTEPVRTRETAGWSGQRIWHERANDWEPAIAADPSSYHVYQLTTRYGRPACDDCPDPWIVFRSSTDGGETWGRDRALCACLKRIHQFDPQIEVAQDGTIFAAWVDGLNPRLAFSRSSDHGRSWSRPIAIQGPVRFPDRPVIAVSPDAGDVHVAFSSGAGYVASSDDHGRTFSRPVQTSDDRRLYFTGGGVVAPDGTVTFAQTSYHRSTTAITHDPPPLKSVKVLTISSHDDGRTWRGQVLDSFREWPACVSTSCPRHYYGPQAALGGDDDGDLLLVTNGTIERGGEQHIYVRRSTDGGRDWTSRRRVSPRHANAAFPAAVGAGDGEFRILFMDDRRGEGRAWNVWYRRSSDGGKRWGPPARISDAVSGTAYKSKQGFREPYGDYGEIEILSTGGTIAVWGEGDSYAGPGGTWFNRSAR